MCVHWTVLTVHWVLTALYNLPCYMLVWPRSTLFVSFVSQYQPLALSLCVGIISHPAHSTTSVAWSTVVVWWWSSAADDSERNQIYHNFGLSGLCQTLPNCHYSETRISLAVSVGTVQHGMYLLLLKESIEQLRRSPAYCKLKYFSGQNTIAFCSNRPYF